MIHNIALGVWQGSPDVPTVPVILGILLGGNMEDALRRAMTLSDGDATYLFSSWIAIGLWVAAMLIIIVATKNSIVFSCFSFYI